MKSLKVIYGVMMLCGVVMAMFLIPACGTERSEQEVEVVADGGTGGEKKPECTENTGCANEQHCVDGKCVDLCPTGACKNGTCVVEDHKSRCECDEGYKPGKGLTCEEKKCKTNADCAPDEYCDDNDRCVKTCKNDDQCGKGRVCEKERCVEGCRDDKGCDLRTEVCENGKCVEAQCYPSADGVSGKACPRGLVCKDKQCVQGCNSDDDCTTGQICHNEKCMQGCRDDGGCQGGQKCYNMKCYQRCTAHAECPAGMVCKDNKCMAGCLDDSTCTTGQICKDNACVAGCREDKNCSTGQVCTDNKCVQKNCTSDSDCTNGMLCKEGVCKQGCKSDDQCPRGQICNKGYCEKGCRKDGDCSNGQICDCDGEGCVKQCVAGCRTDDECPSGQVCTEKKCVKACTAGSCQQGYVCKDGRCEKGPPPEPQVEPTPEVVQDAGLEVVPEEATPESQPEPQPEPQPEGPDCHTVAPTCTCTGGWRLVCYFNKKMLGNDTKWMVDPTTGYPAQNCVPYNPTTWEQECPKTLEKDLHCKCQDNGRTKVTWTNGGATSTYDAFTVGQMAHCQDPTNVAVGKTNKVWTAVTCTN